MTKLKLNLSCLKSVFNFLKKLILLIVPFLLMDIFIRVFASGVKYHLDSIVFPNILFTVSWIAIIITVSCCLKGKAGQIFYGICFGLFFIMYFAHAIYYPYTGFFFSFKLLQSAEEGIAYVFDTIKQAGLFSLLSSLLVLILGILATVKFPRTTKNRIAILPISLIIFGVVNFHTPTFLGEANRSLEWDTWRNPRNVFEDFSDSNKNIKICGLYEYTVRDLYISFFKPEEKQTPEEMEFIKQTYGSLTFHEENEYTGMFKDKNVIFLQLEGIDSWLLNTTDMPNLTELKKNALIFDNHYSYYTGGGSTFNSELAVTTGFLTPISYSKNPYSFNTNSFPGSLPNQLKNLGYTVNAFHMNSGEYYMREMNYLNWGYDNYYSLMDEGNYTDISYQLDTELIENEFFYEKMFKQKEPFMNYIISFTTHTPFNLDSPMAKLLTDKVYGKDGVVPMMNEEYTARFFAAETDRMVGLLMKALEDNGLIENTIIVAFADHYLYTLNDKTILDKYKRHTDNNLINHTPFFIWSYDLQKKHIGKVNSQLDILPTVLNLLGVNFYDEHYIGKDILDDNYSGYVFFSDYSWYDGVNYVEFGQASDNTSADTDYINQVNAQINNLIRKNDLTLKYDVFKRRRK